MKKKLNRLSLLGASFIACSGIVATGLSSCACNQEAKEDETIGKLTYDVHASDQKIVVTGLSNKDKTKIKTITVPATIDGKEVVSISNGAFNGCSNLEKITLPFIGRSQNSIQTDGMFGVIFGSDMYDGCGSVTWQEYTDDETNATYAEKYAIPNSLTKVEITNAKKIPDGAFSGCKFLEEVVVDKCDIETIGKQSFYFCASLQDFNFANLTKLKTIDNAAFKRCYTIENINIPSTVTTIKKDGFEDCILAKTATIPSSVEYVGDNAFKNFYGGLIMVEAKSEEIQSKWSPTWTDSDATMVFDYKNGGYKYLDDWLVIMCGKDNEKYGYLAQWMGNWQQTSVVIPSKLNDNGTEIQIKEVGARCFYQNYYVKNLTIEEGIEKIFPCTFQECTQLEYITIPESLKVIGSYAFKGCTNLKGQYDGIVKTNGIDFKNVEIIGAQAFYNCSSIQDIDLSKVVKIYSEAFAYCTHLCPTSDKALLIPSTCDTIGEGAFKWCFKYAPEGVTDTYYYPTIKIADNSKLTVIPNACFKNCGVRYLKPTTGEDAGVQYPRYIRVNMDYNHSKIEIIGDEAYKDTWLAQMKNARETVITYIGDYAFYNACPTSDPTKGEEAGLPDLQMDDCIEYIGDYAFYGNTTIQKLTFNYDENHVNHLKHLGQYAFAGCTHSDFQELDLGPCRDLKWYWGEEGETYTTAHSPYRAFYNCTNLRKVQLPGVQTIIPPKDPEVEYKPNTEFKYIPERMFDNCTSLGNDVDRTPLLIPDTVKGIRYAAFAGCKNLQKAYVDGVIDFWGSSIFSSCQSLQSITKSDGEEVEFASDIISDNIGTSCYSGCSKLVNGPQPVGTDSAKKWELKSSMYANNLALTDITLKKRISNIGSSCFSECSNLKTVTIPENSELTTISSSAFYHCTALEEIKNLFENSKLQVIGSQAFDGCENIPGKLDFTKNTKATLYSIGDYAFRDCTSLTEIKLKDRYGFNMGIKPFVGCNNLTKVYFSQNLTNHTKAEWTNTTTLLKDFRWKTTGGSINQDWTFTYVGGEAGHQQFKCSTSGLDDLIFEFYVA